MSSLDEIKTYTADKQEDTSTTGSVSPADMFKEEQIDTSISSFADKVKSVLGEIRELFLNEDWDGLGQYLADGVNIALGFLYDAFNWENVKGRLCGRDYIFLSKGDFYGYRRRTLFLLKEKLMSSDEAIIEKWKNDRCLRRYVSLEEASKELQLSESRTKELAKKANAAVVFGKLFRVNMNALYEYIDRERVGVEKV